VVAIVASVLQVMVGYSWQLLTMTNKEINQLGVEKAILFNYNPLIE